MSAAIVAWSLYLPGVEAGEPAYPAAEAHRLLGRKGLLGKEPATRLALCAVHRALGGRHPSGVDPRTAVVASSNLGNVATVVAVVDAVLVGGRRDVSPLSAPNASSNALASAVSRWYGCGGPSVMLCSGATSGLDAVTTGVRLLQAGRADRVIVVGAEPDDEVARSYAPSLVAGAACVVLVHPSSAPYAPTVHLGQSTQDTHTPDLSHWGDLYGTLGVAQTAVAAASGEACRVVCGDPVDGWRTVEVQPARSEREVVSCR